MKEIDVFWFKASKTLLIYFGVPLILIGICLYFIYNIDVILINGFLWIALAFFMTIKGKYDEYKLNKTKQFNIVCEGYIIRIIPYNMIRYGSYLTARVQCRYKFDNKEYFIKSGLYLLTSLDKIENLHPRIYVHPQNRSKSKVVLLRNEVF